MGKTFLVSHVHQTLSSEGYAVGWFEPAAPKLLLTEIAELLGVELKTLEGRSLTADGLQKAITVSLQRSCEH